jgi:hypothetical protein
MTRGHGWRLMVRSIEGWRRYYVWSTWSQYDNRMEAYADLFRMEAGGVVATVIKEEEYDSFCRYKTMC